MKKNSKKPTLDRLRRTHRFLVRCARPHSRVDGAWSIPSKDARRCLGKGYKELLHAVGARVVDSSYRFVADAGESYTKAWSVPSLDRRLQNPRHHVSLQKLERMLDRCPGAEARCRVSINYPSSVEKFLAQAASANDLRILKKFLLVGVVHGDVLHFREGYTSRLPGGSARLYSMFGEGTQNLSRACKATVFGGGNLVDVDLKNAHPTMLPWLWTLPYRPDAILWYAQKPEEARKQSDRELGMTSGFTKQLARALVYGLDPYSGRSPAFAELVEEFSPDGRDVDDVVDKMLDSTFLDPFIEELQELRQDLYPSVGAVRARKALAMDLHQLERNSVDAMVRVLGAENIVAYVHDGLICRGADTFDTQRVSMLEDAINEAMPGEPCEEVLMGIKIEEFAGNSE